MTKTTTSAPLAALVWATFAAGIAGCGSNAPAGDIVATCEAPADCGGQTPLCRGDGYCVQCTDSTTCGGDTAICSDGLCAECGADADCPNDEPFCGDGRCRECRDSADCGVASPVCTPRGQCEPACETAADCNGEQVCHSTVGACVQCETNTDCPADSPLCDPDSFRCVDCLTADDCGVASPFCVRGRCEECVQNTDCGAGQACNRDLECQTSCTGDADCTSGDRSHCNTDTGMCVECVEDVQCGGGERPVCVTNQCVECRTNEDCPIDAPICGPENQCRNN